jgi:hypothetical protein
MRSSQAERPLRSWAMITTNDMIAMIILRSRPVKYCQRRDTRLKAHGMFFGALVILVIYGQGRG